jgi:hypothetical protein
MPRVGSPTYTTLEQFARFCGTAGRITGGTINNLGSGNISVDAGTGIIRTTSSETGELKFIDWSAKSSTAIPSNTIRYVGVIYNSGSPIVEVRTTDNWNYYTEFPLGQVANDGSDLHVEQNGREFPDQLGRLIRRFRGTRPYERDERTGGLVIGETGTRNVTLSTGVLWDRSNDWTIAAKNTSGADRFDAYYRNGAGGWTEVASQSQWSNTQYDDGSGVLATLGTSKYGVLWWYVSVNGDLWMVYGQAQYTSQAAAAASTAPSSLPAWGLLSKLIGRFIFQKSASTAHTIETVWTSTFGASGVVDHGTLVGLADSDHPVSALAFTASGMLAGRSTSGAGAGEEIAFSATPAASTIPRSGAGGTLDAGWIPGGVEIGANGLIADILATTPTSRQVRFATDAQTSLLWDGSQWWVGSEFFAVRSSAPDIGIYPANNTAGFGQDYLSGRRLSNCRVGSWESTPTAQDRGAVRNYSDSSTGKTEIALWDESALAWRRLVAGILLANDPTTRALYSYDYLYPVNLFTGQSDWTDPDGVPMIQDGMTSVGAYQTTTLVTDGTF